LVLSPAPSLQVEFQRLIRSINQKTNEIRINHTEKGKSVMKLYSNNIKQRIVPWCCVLACHLLVLYFHLCFFTITRCLSVLVIYETQKADL
jgi:hypothetical protein